MRDFAALLAGPAGDALVGRGLIDPAGREAAIVEARRLRCDAIDCLFPLRDTGPARGGRANVAEAIAAALGLEVAALDDRPPAPGLPRIDDLQRYVDEQILPWYRRPDGVTVFACACPDVHRLALAEELAGGPACLAVTTRPGLATALATAFAGELTARATGDLRWAMPAASAGEPAPAWQKRLLPLLAVALGLGFATAPGLTGLMLSIAIGIVYLANLVLRGLLVWGGLGQRRRPAPALADQALPPYTVLIPLYREPDILPLLADALRRLDYPPALLDVKLLLEADDAETLAAARDLGLGEVFDVVAVPPSQPRTKPKACNYALPLARGRLLVIFDAEDRPEADQLRKAAAALQAGPPELACVQARLNFYNAGENWLTRMFALDYALWFDYLLPGLDRLGLAIPLGGTSNHFRVDALRRVRAWDPYNVTEDADLGVRLSSLGYRVGLIDSTTFEEATTRVPDWIRQRSRWLKGYMITFAVQMRHPWRLLRSLGPGGFVGFLAFVAGTPASALLNPVVWGAWLAWLAGGAPWLDPLFPLPVKIAGLLCWLAGNALFLQLALIAPFRRHWFGLAPWALTITPYWLLASVAGWRALWQSLRQPFLWEKTRHGLSRHVQSALAGRRGPP